jgi:phenylacetate-coenzyme A ligase PaaK-like adenylate-forming protein
MIKTDRTLEKMFQFDPYSLPQDVKTNYLFAGIKVLTQFHIDNNESYGNILNSIDYDENKVSTLGDFPLLPVRIFKEIELVTNPENLKIRSLNSSGTSGQFTSKIFLDSETSALQTKTLVKIISHYIGKNRIPMLVIDSPSTTKNRTVFSARAAGILGFSKFASDVTYALNDDMSPDWQAIRDFEAKHKDKPTLIFGFTAIVWLHLVKAMNEENVKLDLKQATFFHGGGWKKISEADQVTKDDFRKEINTRMGVPRIFDYYGMAEQTGSILVECEFGFMHTSIYSEIIIRNPTTLQICPLNETGLVETISLLPKSYPGHVLLTEDLGRQIGVDDCACQKLGSYFLIEGRIKRAEIRGCSDTYQVD